MKYYLDTEFIEGFHKPLWGKHRHHIDLISIGIVAEDGREYSRISKDYNYYDASPWVKENVISKLYTTVIHGDARNREDVHSFHKHYGVSNYVIAHEIKEFCSGPPLPGSTNDISFYGYYCDYDWVLLCSLYGTMMNLPKGWPMYCRDLKQTLDEVADNIHTSPQKNLQDKLRFMKAHIGYPKEMYIHNALGDAKWNRDLHKFLMNF